MGESNPGHATTDSAEAPPDEAAIIDFAARAAHAVLGELPAVQIREMPTQNGMVTIFLHGLIRRPVESDDANDRELIVAMLRSALGDRIYNGAW